MIAKKLEQETGMPVAWIREGAGVVLQKLKAEKSSPRCDVWFGGTWDAHAEAAELGLLQSYIPGNIGELKNLFQNPVRDHLVTGAYGGVLGLAVNETLLTKMGKPLPKTWSDLTDPAYKGLVAMSNPNTAGTGFMLLATFVRLYGEEAAFQYLKKLHANIPQYTQSGAAPGLLAGKGEVAVAMIFLQDATKARLQGYPLKEVIPAEGAGFEIGGLSLVKNGPNPAGGKQFIDWVLTPRIQEAAVTVKAFQTPSNRKARIDANIVSMDNIKRVDVPMDWMIQNRERLLDRWNREIFSLSKNSL